MSDPVKVYSTPQATETVFGGIRAEGVIVGKSRTAGMIRVRRGGRIAIETYAARLWQVADKNSHALDPRCPVEFCGPGEGQLCIDAEGKFMPDEVHIERKSRFTNDPPK